MCFVEKKELQSSEMVIITDGDKIANYWNEHFATVGEQLISIRNSGINTGLGHIDSIPFSCLSQSTTLNEKSSILSQLKLNKSIKLDGIPSEIILESSDVISPITGENQ